LKKSVAILLSFHLLICCKQQKNDIVQEINEHPNIIYILADDLGYGNVSSFNPNSKIKTLFIDLLANQGMSFTDAHSGSSLCTPTRYGILTGRYAWRSRLKKGVLWSYDKPLIEKNRLTVASLLKKNEYNTACIGKWLLGLDWAQDSVGGIQLMSPIKNTPIANEFDKFLGLVHPLIYLLIFI